jgi:hypothetical protein
MEEYPGICLLSRWIQYSTLTTHTHSSWIALHFFPIRYSTHYIQLARVSFRRFIAFFKTYLFRYWCSDILFAFTARNFSDEELLSHRWLGTSIDLGQPAVRHFRSADLIERSLLYWSYTSITVLDVSKTILKLWENRIGRQVIKRVILVNW